MVSFSSLYMIPFSSSGKFNSWLKVFASWVQCEGFLRDSSIAFFPVYGPYFLVSLQAVFFVVVVEN